MSTCVHKYLIGLSTTILISLASASAGAVPISFIYSSSGSGSLGGVPFDSAFSITAMADSDDIVVPMLGVLAVEHLSASILFDVSIEGQSSFDFVRRTQTFFNDSIDSPYTAEDDRDTVGFQVITEPGDATPLSVPDFTVLIGPKNNAALDGWNLITPIGPVTGIGELLQWNFGSILVNSGLGGSPNKRLIFDDAMPMVTATGNTSPVPLPAALPLMGSALALFGLLGWYRRRLTSD